MYTDDLPSPAGTLFAGLVLSTKPHAKLLGVDPSEALKVDGVLRFLGSEDVTPGGNGIGAVIVDEEVFAVDEVRGQYALPLQRSFSGTNVCLGCW